MAESETRSGTGPIIFIVGGLVVAVAVLFWFFMGGEMPAVSSGGGDPDVNISVDSSTDSAPAAEPAPEAEPAETGDSSGN